MLKGWKRALRRLVHGKNKAHSMYGPPGYRTRSSPNAPIENAKSINGQSVKLIEIGVILVGLALCSKR